MKKLVSLSCLSLILSISSFGVNAGKLVDNPKECKNGVKNWQKCVDWDNKKGKCYKHKKECHDAPKNKPQNKEQCELKEKYLFRVSGGGSHFNSLEKECINEGGDIKNENCVKKVKVCK